MLQLEGPERDVLGSDEEFARENTLGRAAAQGFLGGEADEIGIVVFLRNVGKDEIARNGVEAIGVAKIFAYGVIRKMAGPAENALLDDPGIRADLEHVQIVIGFEDQAIGAAEMHFDQFGHVALAIFAPFERKVKPMGSAASWGIAKAWTSISPRVKCWPA